ncbi:MAG: hypothetical protein ABSG30_03690 [Steroidobacteraceae bacterium]
MKKVLLRTLPAALLLPVLVMAQSAFVGTWKADLSNNVEMPKQPFRYLLIHDVYRCEICAPPYSVKADGQDHEVAGHPYFDTVRIKIINDSSIEETDKKGGKTVTVTTTQVAKDGMTELVTSSDSSNSNGAPVDSKIELTRVAKGTAGSHAISGSWRMTKFESVSDNGELVTYALSGSTLRMTAPTGQSFAAPVDGTDSPFSGDPGQTSVSIKRIDDRTVDEIDKRDGKVISTEHMTVSADGKTMTVAWKDLLHGTSGSFTSVKQ